MKNNFLHPNDLARCAFEYFNRRKRNKKKPNLRHDGFISIFGKSRGTVMHNTGVVVKNSVIRDGTVIVLLKIVLPTGLNVFPDDGDPLIAICRTLLVIKSESVHKLVYDGAVSKTAGRLEINDLALFVLSYVRPAARARATHAYEVLIALFVRSEAYACLVVISLQGFLDLLYFFFVYKKFFLTFQVFKICLD